MTYKVLRAHNGKHVIQAVTPEGVTGYVASDVPIEALSGLHAKITARIRELELSELGNAPGVGALTDTNRPCGGEPRT